MSIEVKTMKKRLSWLGALVLLLSLLPLQGKDAKVKVLTARLLSRADYLSSTLATLSKGEKVAVLETQGNWLKVKSPSGGQGFLHLSALDLSGGKASLSGLLPGQKGTSEKEVAMAAKGFNEGNEKKLKGTKGYNFQDLEWVMTQKTSTAEVSRFIQKGKLK